MFVANLIHQGKVEIADHPLCSIEQINQAYSIVLEEQYSLFGKLPDGHIWKEGKLAHMGIVDEVKQPIIALFKDKMCSENFALLEFIFRVHDLGRVPEALKKMAKLPEGYRTVNNHAEESVLLLMDWNVLFGVLPAATSDFIRYAIHHHIGPWTPEMPKNPTHGDDLRVFITALLRDMDKYATFLQKTASYLHDPEKKRQEIQIHGFAGEQYRINPESFIKDFTDFQIPNKSDIISYESYMLYFLSWMFDVNIQTVLSRIANSGAITQLLEYFRAHLSESDYQIIKHTTTSYLAEKLN